MFTLKIRQFVAALQPMTRQHSYDEYSLGKTLLQLHVAMVTNIMLIFSRNWL